MKRVAALLAVGGIVAAVWNAVGCERAVRVGTYNIELLGEKSTDMKKLATTVRDVDADVLAVQEIKDAAKLESLARDLSGSGRTYKVALSKCGGKSELHLGFLYDEKRVTLRSTSEPSDVGDERCGSERPMFVGAFRAGNHEVTLVNVHFTALPSAYEKRQDEWKRAHALAAKLRSEGATVLIIGDTNATGYRDDANGERTFIEDNARKVGMKVVTSSIGCSAYWKPNDRDRYEPSLLDHAVIPEHLAKTARVHGYCKRLACASSASQPDGYADTSDHCPVTFDLAP